MHLNSDAVCVFLKLSFDHLLIFNILSSSWGLAAMNSYRAYGDSQSLQYAESIWMDLSGYMVTPEAASAGKLSTKNATFSSTCGSRGQNISTAGAVFYVRHHLIYLCYKYANASTSRSMQATSMIPR